MADHVEVLDADPVSGRQALAVVVVLVVALVGGARCCADPRRRGAPAGHARPAGAPRLVQLEGPLERLVRYRCA